MSRRRSRTRSVGAAPGRERWGPADWAHLRRGQRIAARYRRDRRWRWARWLGGGGAVALAAVAAAGLTARVLRPTAGWVPQVAALGLPVVGPALGLSALAAGAYAARARRPAVGVAAVALAAAAAAVFFRVPTPPAAPSAAAGLRVMTLNVGQRSAESTFRVADYVERMEPHVIFLQEADARSVLRDGQRARVVNPAIEAVLQTGAYRVAGRVDTLVMDGAEPANQQVVLSRLPVTAHGADALGPLDTDPSIFARVEVEWRGQRVALYNVHLRPFNPSAGWSLARAVSPEVWGETPGRLRAFFAVQSEEAERLAALLDAEPLPFVVAGDFNATPDQWSRALLSRRASEVFGRRLWAATRPDAVPLAPIDGILVGAGWSVRSAEVGPPGLSDHRALVAELAYAG